MFSKVFDGIGLAFSKVVPFAVVLMNHVHHRDSGWNIHLIGWVIAVILIYFAFLKPMNEKVLVWDIKDKHKLFVLNYRHLRGVIVFGMLWVLWISLSKNYETIYLTLMLIFFSLLTGWIFRILAYVYSNKE